MGLYCTSNSETVYAGYDFELKYWEIFTVATVLMMKKMKKTQNRLHNKSSKYIFVSFLIHYHIFNNNMLF